MGNPDKVHRSDQRTGRQDHFYRRRHRTARRTFSWRTRTTSCCQTPGLLVCVYGNCAYEDTLTELQDLAARQGLYVIAAVAAVAKHSILHQYAAGRPDTEDIRILRNFGEKIFQQIKSGPVQETVLSLPGSRPYKAYGGVGMIPKANKNCTKCGLYSKNYPTQPPLHRLRAQTRRNASPVCAASPDAPFRPGKSVASCCPLSPWH